MYTPYVRITTGNVATVLDVNPTNPLGTIYSPPQNQALPATTKGFAAQPVYKYVQYVSTATPAPIAQPGVVYYTDETFTKVTAVETEALGTSATLSLNFGAGYLLTNTTAVSTLTAAILQSSYVWIQVGGFLAGAQVIASGSAVGDTIIPITGTNWIPGRTAIATAPPFSRPFGVQLAAATTGVADVLINGMFWGS